MSTMSKIAEQSLREALAVASAASRVGLRMKVAAAEPSPQKLLRATAQSAWRMGASPPKPKSIMPNARIGDPARTRSTAKPPSKKAFYRDMILGMDPSHGSRMAVKG